MSVKEKKWNNKGKNQKSVFIIWGLRITWGDQAASFGWRKDYRNQHVCNGMCNGNRFCRFEYEFNSRNHRGNVDFTYNGEHSCFSICKCICRLSAFYQPYGRFRNADCNQCQCCGNLFFPISGKGTYSGIACKDIPYIFWRVDSILWRNCRNHRTDQIGQDKHRYSGCCNCDRSDASALYLRICHCQRKIGHAPWSRVSLYLNDARIPWPLQGHGWIA